MDAQFVQLIQLAINGISTGAIYSLVALGLVLAYRAVSYTHLTLPTSDLV